MPPEILSLTRHFMREPAKILVKSDELTLEGIRQFYVPVEQEDWKIDVLVSIYGNMDIGQAVIFCNTRKRVEELEKAMVEHEFVVATMHSEKD
jgi:translation initiation factor 4A